MRANKIRTSYLIYRHHNHRNIHTELYRRLSVECFFFRCCCCCCYCGCRRFVCLGAVLIDHCVIYHARGIFFVSMAHLRVQLFFLTSVFLSPSLSLSASDWTAKRTNNMNSEQRAFIYTYSRYEGMKGTHKRLSM